MLKIKSAKANIMRIKKQWGHFWLSLAVSTCVGIPHVWAQSGEKPRADHTNVQENLPLQLDDATPIDTGTRQFQTALRYERTSDKKDRLFVEPRFDWGFASGWEARISTQILAGSAENTNSGDVQVEFHRAFTQNTARLPALGVSVRAELPSGKESHGLDTLIEGHVSRILKQNDPAQPALHLNVGWWHNAEPIDEEVAEGWRMVVGYSRSLATGKNTGTTLVIDYAGEEDPRQHETHHLAEVGVRRQISERFVWSLGVSKGLTKESPPVHANLGTQWAF